MNSPTQTYWNGQPTPARQVRVRVVGDPGAHPLSWWIGLEGTERNAVEVTYAGHAFYLDDDDVPPEVRAAQENRLAELPERQRRKYERLLRIAGRPTPGRAGDGWAKVTEGRGGPSWPHRSLPEVEVLGEVSR